MNKYRTSLNKKIKMSPGGATIKGYATIKGDATVKDGQPSPSTKTKRSKTLNPDSDKLDPSSPNEYKYK